jgi:tetratricopeptide (TPR) repeat protein
MSEQFNDLVSEAASLAKEKRYDESAVAFQRLFESAPGDPTLLRELASVLLDVGQAEMALSLLADSVNPEAPDVPTLRQIGTILRGHNRLDEAADILISALANDPQNQELFDETFLLFKQLGRESELVTGDAGDGA